MIKLIRLARDCSIFVGHSGRSTKGLAISLLAEEVHLIHLLPLLCCTRPMTIKSSMHMLVSIFYDPEVGTPIMHRTAIFLIVPSRLVKIIFESDCRAR